MKAYLVGSRTLLVTALVAFVTLFLVASAAPEPQAGELLSQAGLLVISWLIMMGVLVVAGNYLFYHLLLGCTPKKTSDERDETYLKFLRIRAYVLWAYQSDPYENDAGPVEESFYPVDLVLPRHVVEKITVWAEQESVSVSDAIERLTLLGLADSHLIRLAIGPGPNWMDQFLKEVGRDSLG